jgi:hypothetical protein
MKTNLSTSVRIVNRSRLVEQSQVELIPIPISVAHKSHITVRVVNGCMERVCFGVTQLLEVVALNV